MKQSNNRNQFFYLVESVSIIKSFLSSIAILNVTMLASIACSAVDLPKGFVYLEQIDPSVIQDIRYAGYDNFIGKPVPGYLARRCIMTRAAAVALSQVQQRLQDVGLSLKILDAYRPQTASDYFVKWAYDKQDDIMKAVYYPNVDKPDLFKKGYITQHSAHSRGSTVDVSIVNLSCPNHLKRQNFDMGTSYDYFDITSHTLNPSVSRNVVRNRLYLKKLMEAAGFSAISAEWWHFTLKKEPYPNTYFNFSVQ